MNKIFVELKYFRDSVKHAGGAKSSAASDLFDHLHLFLDEFHKEISVVVGRVAKVLSECVFFLFSGHEGGGEDCHETCGKLLVLLFDDFSKNIEVFHKVRLYQVKLLVPLKETLHLCLHYLKGVLVIKVSD